MRGAENNGLAGGIASAIIMALGVFGAGWFVASGLVESRVVERAVTVSGTAEREVTADLAVWVFDVAADGATVAAAQGAVDAAFTTVAGALTQSGLDAAEIAVEALQVEDRLGAPGAVQAAARYRLIQPVTVRSRKVALVAEQSRALAAFARQGLQVSAERGPVYLYTDLAAIEDELSVAAVRAARAAAQRLADESGARLAGVRQAEAPVLTLHPRDAAPGMAETDSIFKVARATAAVSYLLDD